MGKFPVILLGCLGVSAVAFTGLTASRPAPREVVPPRRREGVARRVTGQQANSFGPATLLRKLKEDLPQFEWLADGSGSPSNKVDMPDYVKQVLSQPSAPKREAESEERTQRIRGSLDAAHSYPFSN
jgi:hypothetical protein